MEIYCVGGDEMKKLNAIIFLMVLSIVVSSCRNQESTIEDSNGDTMDESSELPMSTDGESTEDGEVEVATDMEREPIVHTAHERWELMTRFPDKLEAGGYKYIERELYISDFADIEVGYVYDGIVELLGEPNGWIGSGFLYPYYQLVDSSCVVVYDLMVTFTEGGGTKLHNIQIVDRSGRRFTYKSFLELDTERNDEIWEFSAPTHYERDLYLSDFVDVELDDSYADIVELLGEPNGFAGSETKWPYYQLIDGTNVVLQVNRDENGSFTELFNIAIVDRGGRRFTLKFEEEPTQ
jgi:hypothetical protein